MKSRTRCKGLRGNWTEEKLIQGLDVINYGVSVRKASIEYKIPRRTLRNHARSGNKSKSMGRKITLSESEEKQLVQRIIRFCDIGFPLTKKMIRTYVFDYVMRNNIRHQFSTENELPGERGWIHSFQDIRSSR